MAPQPSKITSEIIQTCRKFFSNVADTAIRAEPSFRYKLANLQKPRELPELTFKQEPEILFAELQPSASPEFRFEFNQAKWAADRPPHQSPFPQSIKPKDCRHVVYSDMQKAEDKMLKCKMASFYTSSRHLSTSARQYSRGPADNSSSGKCADKKKGSDCKKPFKKDCKIGATKGKCANLKLNNCVQSKGSDCRHHYIDTDCVKVAAPYPSYSESCAEQLPENPSECQQCPWRTCDGADTIEPGKPVRSKRNYSTYCSRHLDATAGVAVVPPPGLADISEYLSKIPCGSVKKPCKEPPGPCEERRKQEEAARNKKKGGDAPRKKASEEAEPMVLSDARQTSRVLAEESLLTNKSSWSDLSDGEGGMLLNEKKQKYPNCEKVKKPRRPKDKAIDRSQKETCVKPKNRKNRTDPDFY